MTHRRDIEGLRALAVAVVVLYHLGVPGFGGGFVGVDVFFVISGFLITSLLLDERSANGRVCFLAFYARRVRRLLPISAVVLSLTAFTSAVWLPATRFSDIADDMRAAALFGANLLFAERGTDYLTATLDPSPLQHYWSLAVEEQFYLVWPALIALVTVGATGARAVRSRATLAMGVLVVVSFVASGLLTASYPSWSYFGLHTRAWELGIGALLASVLPTIVLWSPARRTVIGWVGMVTVVVSSVTFEGVTAFPGWAAAIPVVATTAVIAAGDDLRYGPNLLLGCSPLQSVGARSYSLYLWHWPVLVVAEGWLLRPLDTGEKIIASFAFVALAETGFRLVENPLRRSTTLVRRPALSTALGGALVCLGVLSGAILATSRADVSTGVVADAPDLGLTTSIAPNPDTTLTDASAGGADPGDTEPPADTGDATNPTTTAVSPSPPSPIRTRDLPALGPVIAALANDVAPENLRPSLGAARGDTPPIYASGCHQFLASTVRTDCVFGDPSGSVTIALWGDSHAAQWFTPLATMAQAHGWRMLSLTQGSCSFLDVTVYDRTNNREFTNCTPWRDSVRALMRSEGVDLVFVSQHFGLLDADTDAPIAPTRWRDELPRLIRALRADGVEPVLIGDTPNPDTTVPDCIAERSRSVSACAAPQYDNDDRVIVDTIREVVDSARVGFVEPGEWLCDDDGRCPAIIGDILVYRDGNHIGETASTWLSPLFDAVIAPFVRDWADSSDRPA